MARLEGSYEQLDKRIGDFSARVDTRFAQVDARFAQVDVRLESMDKKIDGLQWRMTALIVGTWIATMSAVILHR